MGGAGVCVSRVFLTVAVRNENATIINHSLNNLPADASSGGINLIITNVAKISRDIEPWHLRSLAIA